MTGVRQSSLIFLCQTDAGRPAELQAVIYLTHEMAGHSFVRPWLETKGVLFFISSSTKGPQEDLGGVAAACGLETTFACCLKYTG